MNADTFTSFLDWGLPLILVSTISLWIINTIHNHANTP